MAFVVDPNLASVGKELILGNEPACYAQLFEEWFEHHHLLAESTGITDDAQILKLLLLWGGKDFRTFATDAGVKARGAGADTLDAAVTKIKTKCGAHLNLTMAMYNLMHTDQGSKPVTQFVKEIEEQAKKCQFSEHPYTVDRAKRDALVFGTSDNKLRRDALAQDLDYDKLVKAALSYEQSRQSAGKIAAAAEPEDVSRVQAGRYSSRGSQGRNQQGRATGGGNSSGDNHMHTQGQNKCPSCPSHYRPHARNNCPAYGKACAACKGKNHFAGSRNCTQNNVNAVISDTSREMAADSVDTGNTYTFGVNSVHEIVSVGHMHPYTSVNVHINGTKVDMSVDSQCRRTLLPVSMYTNSMGDITSSDVKFRPYGTNAQLKTHGEIKARITSGSGAFIDTVVYVIEGNGNTPALLGELDAMELGILKITKDGMVAKVSDRLEAGGFKVQHNKEAESEQGLSPKGKDNLDKLLDKHAQVFQGVGLLKDDEVGFHIDPSVEPCAAPYRSIPLAFREPLSAHLQFLRDQDKIEDVPIESDPGWVSNVVITEKKSGSLRMNVDMREANKALHHTPRHVETIQEIRHKLKGAKYFAELDMSHGYHQVSLAEESRHISTFRTHEGLHRFKVLFFGAKPATDLFHAKVRQSLERSPKCLSIHDNILIWGNDEEEFLANLDSGLATLKENGWTLRREKCTFGQTSVSWFGWIFSEQGLSADPRKIQAIKDAGKPASSDDVKSFLQAVQFNSKFMFDSEEAYAQITLPLRQLTHKNTHFKWTPACEQSYNQIISTMTSETALRPFDPKLRTVLVTDASQVGIAATVYQDDKGVLKPVDHASRALTDTEAGYSSIERESLGQAWGMQIHRYYLLGRDFDTYTDHEPLLHIYNGKRKGNARIERHRMKVQGFSYNMKYLPGKENPCDYPSRHPLPLKTFTPAEVDDMIVERGDELCISHIVTEDLPDAVTLEMIQKALKRDAAMQKLVKSIEKGHLANDPALTAYKGVFSELCYTNGVILRGDRLLIPDVELVPGSGSLQTAVIDAAHEGHQGEVKTKQLVRSKMWFPALDRKVQEKIKSCIPCQAATLTHTRDPLQPTKLPARPWQNVDLDFKGPLPGGEYLLVAIDEYSRYPEVEIVKSTSAQAMLPHLDKIFATHGFPDVIKTDGGPPFNGSNSHDFAKYLRWAGVRHKVVSPDDPEANGLVENFMKNLSKVWKIAKVENKCPRQELYKFLRHYRATPHTTTDKAPAEILFNRPYKGRVPVYRPETPAQDDDIRKKDDQAKQLQKHYKDRKSNVRPHNMKVGDSVLLMNRQTKGSTRTPYDPDPYRVTNIRGHQITAARRGATRVRDAKKFKKVEVRANPRYVRQPRIMHDEEADQDYSQDPDQQHQDQARDRRLAAQVAVPPPVPERNRQRQQNQPPPDLVLPQEEEAVVRQEPRQYRYPNGHLDPNVNIWLPPQGRRRAPPPQYDAQRGTWQQ